MIRRTLTQQIRNKLDETSSIPSGVNYRNDPFTSQYFARENTITDIKQLFIQFINEVDTTGNDGSEEEFTPELRKRVIEEINRVNI